MVRRLTAKEKCLDDVTVCGNVFGLLVEIVSGHLMMVRACWSLLAERSVTTRL